MLKELKKTLTKNEKYSCKQYMDKIRLNKGMK